MRFKEPIILSRKQSGFLYLALTLIFSIAGFLLVRSARGVAATGWMRIYLPQDIANFRELCSYVRNLRAPIPVVISILEIINHQICGNTDLTTQSLYRISLVACYILSLNAFFSPNLKIIASFMFSVVFLWSAVIIHKLNPQTYDIFFPMFLLLYIFLMNRYKTSASSGKGRNLYLIGAGFFLSMAELSRPFVFFMLPLFILNAFFLLKSKLKSFSLFLIPVFLFSGVWHFHLFMKYRQITWSNHTGFNLSKAWDMVEPPPLVKEVHDAPLKPHRWRNLNTPEHYENSRRLQKTILKYIATHPLESVVHIARQILYFLTPQIRIGKFHPRHQILRVYRPLAWISFIWILLNLYLLFRGFIRYGFKTLASTENTLILAIVLSTGFLAIGETGEQARMILSLLPLLAVFPEYRPPDYPTSQNGNNEIDSD